GEKTLLKTRNRKLTRERVQCFNNFMKVYTHVLATSKKRQFLRLARSDLKALTKDSDAQILRTTLKSESENYFF
ncbi:hypothetical protein S83_055100, partial [Arachis hypogaea]